MAFRLCPGKDVITGHFLWKDIRLLVKHFGSLSEEFVDGFFVALRFCFRFHGRSS